MKHLILNIFLLFGLPPVGLTQSGLSGTYSHVKTEFSKAYFLWNQIRDQTWETQLGDWDSIPNGAFFSSLEIEPVTLEGFIGLDFFEIRKTGNKLMKDGHVLGIHCPHQEVKKDSTEIFLIAIDHLGEVKYLSGDIILSSVYNYLDGPGKAHALATVRTFYLQMESIRLLKKSADSHIFGGYSKVLGKEIRIQLDRWKSDWFRIWAKGKKRSPIQVVGGYD